MSNERLIACLAAFAMVCVTLLISQCTYNVGKCREEAIKAGRSMTEISSICHA